MLAILIIPAGLTATFGRMVGNRRQGWAIYVAMTVLFVAGVAIVSLPRAIPTAAMQAAGLDGDNMEGKEQRFGIGSSSLFAVVTTVASCGAVNAAMESLTGARRRDPAGQHHDRRGHLRRRRLGPLRDAAVRPARGLPRRPHGRPHARVPGQEDRGPRDQARRDRHDRRPAARARVHGDRGRDELRQGVDLRRRAAGLHRVAVRVHLAGEQQRLGVRRLHRLPAAQRRQRRRADRHVRAPPRRRLDAARPLPADARRARGRRRAGGQARHARRPRDDAHRHADVRRPARRDHPPRRAADVRPRAAARADRAGDDDQLF